LLLARNRDQELFLRVVNFAIEALLLTFLEGQVLRHAISDSIGPLTFILIADDAKSKARILFGSDDNFSVCYVEEVVLRAWLFALGAVYLLVLRLIGSFVDFSE
jgi:predicted alpha/beta hydrolase